MPLAGAECKPAGRPAVLDGAGAVLLTYRQEAA
jgi:hypothetical protein